MTPELIKTQVRNLMQLDPIAEAEKFSELANVPHLATSLALSIQIDKSKELQDKLSELGDTHFNITFNETINLLEKYGFERIYSETFGGEYGQNDSYFIYWKDGLLVKVESYKSHVNSGECLFNYELNDANNRRALDGCSYGSIIKGRDVNGRNIYSDTFQAFLDIREGFFLKLENLMNNGNILHRWTEPPFLWFVNYMERKVEGYDYNKISYEKITKFPLHVIEGMFGTIDRFQNYMAKNS